MFRSFYIIGIMVHYVELDIKKKPILCSLYEYCTSMIVMAYHRRENHVKHSSGHN